MPEHSNDRWDAYGESRLLSRNRLILEHHRLLVRLFLDHFDRLDRSLKILDVGCGDGFFLELLRNLGFADLCGIDLSGPMVERAVAKGLRVEKRSLYDLEDRERYDAVLMMDVLEHLDRPRLGLGGIHQALKIGGQVFINVPICDSLANRSRRLLFRETRGGQLQQWDETHIGFYSKREVQNLIAESGFDLLSSRRISNRFPAVGRLSWRLAAFLQQFDLFGLFGDFLTLVAQKN